jgi:Restriction endonuclease
MSRRRADNTDGCVVMLVILLLALGWLSGNLEVLVALVVLVAFGISLWVTHKGISRWERRRNMPRLTSGAGRRRVAPPTGQGWETASRRPTAPTGPLGVPGAHATELTHRLARVRDMSGVEFEAFVADVLRGLGYRVTVMGRTGDQGVDLIATAGDERLEAVMNSIGNGLGMRETEIVK